jgi:hypothetical protein
MVLPVRWHRRVRSQGRRVASKYAPVDARSRHNHDLQGIMARSNRLSETGRGPQRSTNEDRQSRFRVVPHLMESRNDPSTLSVVLLFGKTADTFPGSTLKCCPMYEPEQFVHSTGCIKISVLHRHGILTRPSFQCERSCDVVDLSRIKSRATPK